MQAVDVRAGTKMGAIDTAALGPFLK